MGGFLSCVSFLVLFVIFSTYFLLFATPTLCLLSWIHVHVLIFNANYFFLMELLDVMTVASCFGCSCQEVGDRSHK